MTTLLESVSADLDDMYDVSFGFAEVVSGPSGDFLALFDNEYIRVEGDGTVGISGSSPMLRCRAADALSPGDAVTVRTVGYTVAEVMPDGAGETIMYIQAT